MRNKLCIGICFVGDVVICHGNDTTAAGLDFDFVVHHR